MRSRLVLLTLIAAAGIGRPCFAQTIVSDFPPLSPEDAVRVLRSSHSLLDMANRPYVDPEGPRVYVLPYDRSADVPPPMAPPEPLSRYGMPLPYNGWFDGGYPYAPYGAYVAMPRFHGRQTIAPTTVAPPHTPMQPAPPPARSIVVGAAGGGVVVRRR